MVQDARNVSQNAAPDSRPESDDDSRPSKGSRKFHDYDEGEGNLGPTGSIPTYIP